ncbi:hypothetical protein PINS_up002797 [Pythium insidiosum]|nr:hypothetical protein PINS_up002797 [Pythium insidiosum]
MTSLRRTLLCLAALSVMASSLVAGDALNRRLEQYLRRLNCSAQSSSCEVSSGTLRSLDELQGFLQGTNAPIQTQANVLLDVGDYHLQHDDTMVIAERFVKHSAALGNADAQFLVGALSAVDSDAAKSALYLHFAAQAGSLNAAMALGYRALHGHNAPRSCRVALRHYKTVADHVMWTHQETTPVQVYMAPAFVPLSDDQSKLPRLEQEDLAKAEYLRQRAQSSQDPGLLVRAASLVLFTDLFTEYPVVERRQVVQDAQQWLQRASRLGSSSANALLGHIFAYGLADNDVDTKAATEFYLLAFNGSSSISPMRKRVTTADPLSSGRSEAANGLGLLYMNGVGDVPIDYERAMAYFQEAVRTGHAEGVSNAAHLMRHAHPSRSREYLEAATRVGHLRSTFRLARLLETQRKGTCEEIVELYKRVAEQSDSGRRVLQRAYSAFIAGHIAAARRLFLVAAEMGYAVAETNAAWLSERYGVTGNELIVGDQARNVRASELYRRLVHRGVLQKNADAMLRAGDLAFDQGKMLHAKRFYERALEISPRHARALYSLGFMVEHSLVASSHPSQGNAWTRREQELQHAADLYRRARLSEPALAVVMHLLEFKVAFKRLGLRFLERLHASAPVTSTESSPQAASAPPTDDAVASTDSVVPKFESALAFDGSTTSRVLLETHKPVFHGEWTMETWLRIGGSSNVDAQHVPQVLFEAPDGLIRFELCKVSAGEWHLCVRSSVARKQSLVLSTRVKLYPDRWHHVVIAVSTTRVAVVYVDGLMVDHIQLPSLPLIGGNGMAVVSVGNVPPHSPFPSRATGFRGELLRFRVWQTTLRRSDVVLLREMAAAAVSSQAIDLAFDVRDETNRVLNNGHAVREAQGVLPRMIRVPIAQHDI